MFAWDAPPPVIAHRGAPHAAQENTLAAFRAALDEGATAIELDARLAKDGEVVVHHDVALGRVFRGEGFIEDLPSTGLTKLGVPTLRDALRELPPATLLNVELKPDASNASDLPARVAEIVRDEGALDRVLATSFDPLLSADYGERAGRDVGVIAPFAVFPGDLDDFARIRHVMLVADAAEPEVVTALREAGARVAVWTVNEPAYAMELLDRGATSIITDRPGRLLEALRRRAASGR